MKTVTSRQILIAMTYIFFVMCYIEDTIPAGKVLTLLSLGGMFAAYVTIYGFRFENPLRMYLLYILVFLCYCALSMLWAETPGLTFGIVRRMIFLFIMFSCVYVCHCRDTAVEDFLKIIMYGGYAVVIYYILRYGWGTILRVLSSSERISNQFLNANTLGMCAAYAIVINIYYILYQGIRLTDILMLPAFVMLAASGSRKALVIVIVGAFGVFMLKSIRNDRISNILFKIGAVCIAFVAALIALSRMKMFAGVLKRMKAVILLLNGRATRRTAGYIRMVYVRIGMELFRKQPLFGIGIANAFNHIKQYNNHIHLHNNFVELLACGGIIGFVIYYSIYLYILIQFLRFRRYRDGIYDVCLVIFMIRLAMNYGSVSYYSAPTYFFLLMFMIEIRRLKERARKESVNTDEEEEGTIIKKEMAA